MLMTILKSRPGSPSMPARGKPLAFNNATPLTFNYYCRSTKNDHKGRNSNYSRDVRYQIYPWPKLSMVLLAKTSIPNASQSVSPGTRFSKPASVNNQPFLEAGWCWRWMFPPRSLDYIVMRGNLIILSPQKKKTVIAQKSPPQKKRQEKKALEIVRG